jgi:hypothetical protein
MSDAIQQAIEAMDMARSAVGPFGVVVTRKLTESIEALQALQSGEPVVDVNQQLLNDIINMLVAVKGAIKLGRDADACNYINAAIAAAQESYTYSPDGKMRINKNGNFGF